MALSKGGEKFGAGADLHFEPAQGSSPEGVGGLRESHAPPE